MKSVAAIKRQQKGSERLQRSLIQVAPSRRIVSVLPHRQNILTFRGFRINLPRCSKRFTKQIPQSRCLLQSVAAACLSEASTRMYARIPKMEVASMDPRCLRERFTTMPLVSALHPKSWNQMIQTMSLALLSGLASITLENHGGGLKIRNVGGR